MDKVATSSSSSADQVVVTVQDDAPRRPFRAQGYGARPTANDPRASRPMNFGHEKDYAWFLEDDFKIDFCIEETCHVKKSFLRRMVQWISAVLLLVALACTLKISVFNRLEMWGVSILRWEVFFLVIVYGEFVASSGVQVAVSLIESNFHLRLGVLYVVYGAWQSFKNVVWLGLVMIVWKFIVVDKSVTGSDTQVPRILQKVTLCLLVGTLIWLLKTIIVKALEASFHLMSFFRRIRVSLYKQYVVKKLDRESFECRNREQTRDGLSRRALGNKKVIASKVKRMIEIVQAGDLPSCLSHIYEDLPVRSDEDEDEFSLQEKNEREKVRARDIFRKVAQRSE